MPLSVLEDPFAFEHISAYTQLQSYRLFMIFFGRITRMNAPTLNLHLSVLTPSQYVQANRNGQSHRFWRIDE